MDKIKISDHPYADEFMKEINLVEFSEWIYRTLVRFISNIISIRKRPMSLHRWISWFLDWSEYSDFMKWKDECEDG